MFINEQDSKFTLVGIIKEPVIIGNQVEFYISTTDTGTLTPKMLYLSFTIELEKELNYVQGETISIERNRLYVKNYVGYQFYEKDFELGIVLLGEASYNLGEFIEVDKNITLGINEYIDYQFYNQDFDFDIVNIASTSYNLGEVVSVDKNLNIVLPNYIGLEFLDNDFTLDIYAALNVVATQSTVLEVNKSLELDMYNFVSGSHLNKNYAFELYGIAEVESVIGETVEIDQDIEATIGLGIEKEYEIVSSIGVETYLVADTEAYISNVLDIESDLGITMYYDSYMRQDEYVDLGLDLGLDLIASYNLGEVVSVNKKHRT